MIFSTAFLVCFENFVSKRHKQKVLPIPPTKTLHWFGCGDTTGLGGKSSWQTTMPLLPPLFLYFLTACLSSRFLPSMKWEEGEERAEVMLMESTKVMKPYLKRKGHLFRAKIHRIQSKG